jgi:hypothetical protein
LRYPRPTRECHVSFKAREHNDREYSRRYPIIIAIKWPKKLVFGTNIDTRAHANSGDVQVGIFVVPRL